MENLDACLLAIQVNLFDCGGIAIGVCMLHKFGDTSTVTNFTSDWAIIGRKNHLDKEALSRPVLDAASAFPGDDFHLPGRPAGVVFEKGHM
ncbi:vinorine synthase-like [Quillaja saponaria]|uniref:Vinorine synthase-like n=1 Tax=Quillaja saponaria TaxID=32244 RepID=A0AAD7KTW3_QUISA|nr:vinorine synthase-like [Quillaja saponaria]